MVENTYSGYVAIAGRPNVGKSTLLNQLIEQKLSITSRKPQTTRHTLVGIKTEGNTQIVFVDTPGIHGRQDKAINRYMNRSANAATVDVDVVVFVIDRMVWTGDDERVMAALQGSRAKVIVAVNKTDKLESGTSLIPHVDYLQKTLNPHAIVPISALKKTNLQTLESEIRKLIPLSEFHFPEDQLTDRSMRFLAAELVREKIIRQLGAELPYQVTVEIEQFDEDERLIHIGALILVEREGQKRIIIGDKGSRLKSIGQAARLDMERLFDQKIMLKLWVKVKAGWSDDDRALRSLGYDERTER